MISHNTILVSCHIQDSPQAMPLATSILKSFISEYKSLSVTLLDFYINQTPDEAAEKIIDLNPDSVGFSMYIWNRSFIEKTANLLKRHNNNILIYAGGAEVTASSETFVEHKDFDYFLRGEGELPFKSLMLSFLDEKLPEEGKFLNKNHLQDLNLIPSPFLTGTLDVSLWDGVLWELSRGCPFKCAFCSESRGIDGVRYFDEDRIVRELQLFEEKQVDQIFVLDPTFNINKKRALRILALINEYAPYIHYTFEIRAELLDEELAQQFAEIHCSLQIGLQSADNSVLEKLNRTINKENFSEKISLLNQYGAVFGLDLIYGLPGDSFKGFLSSLDYSLMQIPNHLDIFRLSVFPGTELYDKAEELEIQFEGTAPYGVIQLPGYPPEDLEKSEKVAYAVNLFYNKGRAAGWLLSITDILKIEPSLFFLDFSDFLSEKIDQQDIYQLQIDFLEILFGKHNRTNYLPIANDLALFHYLYGEALHATSSISDNSPRSFTGNTTVYSKNNLLKTGVFSYDVTFYSEMGMIEIESFAHNNCSEPSYALIFNNGYEILTMSVEKYLFDFIEEIDGIKSIEDILLLLKIEVDEIQDLIDFLVESTLIIAVP
jgi:radical SAM superfamily enzyme YgiQ (UPF0313 family)